MRQRNVLNISFIQINYPTISDKKVNFLNFCNANMPREIGINTDITLTHLSGLTLARLSQYFPEEIKDEPIETTNERRSTKRKCQDDMAETERKANLKLRAAKQKAEMEKQAMKKLEMEKLAMEKRAAKKQARVAALVEEQKRAAEEQARVAALVEEQKRTAEEQAKATKEQKAQNSQKIKKMKLEIEANAVREWEEMLEQAKSFIKRKGRMPRFRCAKDRLKTKCAEEFNLKKWLENTRINYTARKDIFALKNGEYYCQKWKEFRELYNSDTLKWVKQYFELLEIIQHTDAIPLPRSKLYKWIVKQMFDYTHSKNHMAKPIIRGVWQEFINQYGSMCYRDISEIQHNNEIFAESVLA